MSDNFGVLEGRFYIKDGVPMVYLKYENINRASIQEVTVPTTNIDTKLNLAVNEFLLKIIGKYEC